MYSITQNRKPLDPDLYRWDEETKTLITEQSNLVLDFTGYGEVTFKTGSGCKFNTGSHCTFKTGSFCTINTGSNCTFETSQDCTFDTSHNCTFDTYHNCTFETGKNCVIIRKDIFEVINMNEIETKKIKLNGHGEAGYEIMK